MYAFSYQTYTHSPNVPATILIRVQCPQKPQAPSHKHGACSLRLAALQVPGLSAQYAHRWAELADATGVDQIEDAIVGATGGETEEALLAGLAEVEGEHGDVGTGHRGKGGREGGRQWLLTVRRGRRGDGTDLVADDDLPTGVHGDACRQGRAFGEYGAICLCHVLIRALEQEFAHGTARSLETGGRVWRGHFAGRALGGHKACIHDDVGIALGDGIDIGGRAVHGIEQGGLGLLKGGLLGRTSAFVSTIGGAIHGDEHAEGGQIDRGRWEQGGMVGETCYNDLSGRVEGACLGSGVGSAAAFDGT